MGWIHVSWGCQAVRDLQLPAVAIWGTGCLMGKTSPSQCSCSSMLQDRYVQWALSRHEPHRLPFLVFTQVQSRRPTHAGGRS